MRPEQSPPRQTSRTLSKTLQSLWAALSVIVALSLSLGASNTLADPMRPLPGSATPSGVPTAATSAAAGPAQRGGSGVATPTPAAGTVPLFAIRLDSTGQRLALIGQQWLKAGEVFTDGQGGFTVLAIAEHHIDFQRGNDRRTAYLLPPLLDSAKPRPTPPGAKGTAPP